MKKNLHKVCLPSLVLSYGVILWHATELGIPVCSGLTTPAIFILTYGLTQCWCRDAADSWGGPVGHRVMATLGLLLVTSGLFICAFVPHRIQPVVYGVMAGFGSSIISAQVDAVIFDTYDYQIGIVRGLCFAGQAIGQTMFPHIISFVIDYYEYSYSYIILAGIMLQTLPAIMILKAAHVVKRPDSFSRYCDRTYAIFKNDGFRNDFQLQDLSQSFWQCPSEDNTSRPDSDYFEDYDENVTITPPPSPEEKRRNMFGVEILPEIPEVSEESDEELESDKNKNKFSLAIKRLSSIGDSFDEYINKQARRDSVQTDGWDNKDYSEVEVTYDTVAPVIHIEREKILNSFNFRCQSAYTSMKRSLRMPSYRMYRFKRRLVYVMYNINDTFIKPLTRSLSCWRFYPALLICFSKLVLTAVSLILLPLIASEIQPKISTTETNFLISLHGFTWLCFLLCTPWLSQTAKSNFKYVAVIGLLISTASSFVLSIAENHDIFSIGCVVAGVGYGAITSCWETSVQDFVGARKWPKIHSTLETLSSILLAVFVLSISFIIDEEEGLQRAMMIITIILALITIVWTGLAVVSIYITNVRSLRLDRRCLF
ncbi:hypothetical protein ACJJTC_017742 [Scirpophaga incertulas]